MKKDYLEKYADILLWECLKLKDNEPLVIIGPMERYDFIRVLTNKAYEKGIKDIYLRISDAYIKHDQLINLSVDELKEIDWWTGYDMEQYAKKGAAFLSLCSEYPGLYSDVDSSKLTQIQKYMMQNCLTYDERRNKNELSWCIAAVPSQDWADKLFPDDSNNLEKLWKLILDICLITTDDPIKNLHNKILISHNRAKKLNDLNIKCFKYNNSLGTDLTVEMPEDYIFHNIEMSIVDGRVIYPNLPSEEIYSSPKKTGVNGIVYASKPLIHGGKIIRDFYLEFKDGKVINYDAKIGKDVLKNIMEFDDNSSYLGELAFVNYDSPISNTNMLFYTTLYDENASCHLALGQSFCDCIKNGEKRSKEELEKIGLNQSLNHVDFMIGTEDLNVIGVTKDNKEIQIFKDGNFVI